MADLAALRATHEARLAGGERREVVVVHVALFGDRVDAVDHLVHAADTQGGDVEHLGFATLEQAGAVGGGHDANLRRQGTQVLRTTAVDAGAVVDDAAAHRLLGGGTEGCLGLLLGVGALGLVCGAGHGGDQLVTQRGFGSGALSLVCDRRGLNDAVTGGCSDGVGDLGAVVHLRDPGNRLGDAVSLLMDLHQLTLQLDHGCDVCLGGLETGRKGLLVHLGGAVLVELPGTLGATGLHHHHGDITVFELAPGNDHVEGSGVGLGIGGMGQPLAIGGVAQADGADGPLEGDARQHQRCRSAVERQHVIGVFLIGTQHEAHHVHLVAEAAGERRTKRPVDQSAGEDCGL